jgi:hypothetical protein
MPVSPYGGMIFAALAAFGGVLQTGERTPAEIALGRGETEMLGGTAVLCAGAGQEAGLGTAAQGEAAGYTLRLALVDGDGNFLPESRILVSRAGGAVSLRLRCRADWLMLKLAPGSYTVTTDLNGERRVADVAVPREGRVRLALSAPRNALRSAI